jgi:hypothetical protein
MSGVANLECPKIICYNHPFLSLKVRKIRFSIEIKKTFILDYPIKIDRSKIYNI